MEGTGGPSRYRYVVVLDLEATCEEVRNPSSSGAGDGTENRLHHEIIEFPWAVVDLKEAKVIEQRQLYVKPEWEENRHLSAFCTKLTGITDAVLAEQGQPLKQCIAIFAQAMHDLQQQDGGVDKDLICVATDGDWDLDVQLRGEAAAKGLDVPYHLQRFINVREEVSYFYKPGREHHIKGLKSLLRYLGLPHQGRHHSGIDDVLNICQIVLRLAADGHAFTPERAVVVGSTDKAAKAVMEADFSKWWSAEELTPEILSVLMGFRPDEVLNIYQFGSRVYECDDNDAHWSFIITMGDYYKGPANFTRGNVHARVGPMWKFEESLRHNDLYQVISLSLPARFVWKETVRFEMIDRLNLRKLARSVLEQFHGQTKAKLVRIFKTDGAKLFVKEILRMFRSVMFGIQLLDEGKVVDYRQANAYQREIEAMGELTVQGCATVVDRFKPELERLLGVFRGKIASEEEDFRRLVERAYQETQRTSEDDGESARGFRLLRTLVQQKGAGLLVRHLPVTVRRSGSLVQLCCDEDELRRRRQAQDCDDEKERPPDLLFADLHDDHDDEEDNESPLVTLLARQCHGVIIDEADGACRVVSLPFPRFAKPRQLADIQHRVDALDFAASGKALCVLPKLNGALCVLYAREGKWKVSSQTSMEADDRVEEASLPSSEGSTLLRDAFWALWSAVGYTLPPAEEQGRRCFLFQLAAEGLGAFAGVRPAAAPEEDGEVVVDAAGSSPTPLQRNLSSVTGLRLPRLLYVGVACLETLHHRLSSASHEFSGWERPPVLVGVDSASALMQLLTNLPPSIASGLIVAAGGDGGPAEPQLWLDSPAYISLHDAVRQLRGEPSEEVMLNVLRRIDVSREETAMLARLPQFAALYASVSHRLWHLIDRVDAEYHRVDSECAAELSARTSQHASQAKAAKDPATTLFASKVGRHPFKQVLFAMRRDHLTAAQYFRTCLMKLLLLNLNADKPATKVQP